jgi:hypothetical protein
MKPCAGVQVQLQALLISALDVAEWFGFLGPASLREWERNWLDLRTSVDDVKDGEIYCPYHKTNPSFSVAQLITW